MKKNTFEERKKIACHINLRTLIGNIISLRPPRYSQYFEPTNFTKITYQLKVIGGVHKIFAT